MKKLSLIIVYRTLCKTDTTQLIMRRNQNMQNKIIKQKYYVCLHAAGPLGVPPAAVRVFMFISWNERTEYKQTR